MMANRLPALVAILGLAAAGAANPAARRAPAAEVKAKAKAATGLTAGELGEVESRLAELGYWTGPVDHRVDPITRQAVIAFQKAEGLRRDGRLDTRLLAALRRAAPPEPRETATGFHLEADLGRQILYAVDAFGKVSRILPISSGTGKPFRGPGFVTTAETPCGHLSVFRKLAGWHKSPLGEMYDPLFLVGGIAIHGSPSVPTRPASHGCIRVPLFASPRLYREVPVDTPVLVYGCKEPAAG
jgi:N-acetylmuramoyl-L-alanine amidase